ncbi:MAG: TonB-dependent receptor plug domain-containing protein [Pseudomonadota bacterium]
MDHDQRLRSRRILSCLLVALPLAVQAEQPRDDLTQYSLEQLMGVEVVSASRYSQLLSDAPAAVSVVTSAEIQRFGYRTLADILGSVRGFHITRDRQYEYVGVRGFSPAGDYNTRLLVLVDGHRVNDNIYDTGAIGGEFPLDVDLIDRVEIVRGPASSLYGSNALFSVVNVITRRGAQVGGGEGAAAISSHGGREGRLSWGHHSASGIDILLSASGLHREGPNLYFPEFDAPETNHGRTTGTDGEQWRKFFARANYGEWGLSLMHSSRDKGLTGGAWDTVFDDPRSRILDEMTLASLSREFELGGVTQASARLYYGDYRYKGDYLYANDDLSTTLNKDVGRGRWWGAELRLLSSLERHKLAYGLEYQDNLRQDQSNFDEEPSALFLDDRRGSQRWGAYLQDEFALTERWLLSAGLRYDHFDAEHGEINPRLALIHRLADDTTLKLLYGSAFRTPNVYERFYAFPDQQTVNPGLEPERIRSIEAVVEHRPAPGLRLTGSVYHYRIDDWIVQQADPDSGLYQYRNQGPVSAEGLELGLERHWANGVHLRANYSAQHAPDRTETALNLVPRHLLNANLYLPLDTRWGLGARYAYTSARATTTGHVGGFGLADLVLGYRPRPGGLQLSLGLYNLFDKRYDDPVIDPGVPEREVMAQDGRTWRLKAVLPF